MTQTLLSATSSSGVAMVSEAPGSPSISKVPKAVTKHELLRTEYGWQTLGRLSSEGRAERHGVK